MSYLEIKVKANADFREIFIAELAELGFDTFQDEDELLIAYGELSNINQVSVEEMLKSYQTHTSFSYTFSQVEKQNWNEEWENNFDPIFVDDKCVVKAPFHTIEQSFDYEIIITPKMSFGTGHHATTHLMLSFLLEQPLEQKSAVDLGCGTGILAIMAAKKGATTIAACDIDPWCVENSEENFTLNNIKGVSVRLGTAIESFEKPSKFDVVLANINKNVLLGEMSHYCAIMNNNGQLFLSGFYEEDINDLVNHATTLGLTLVEKKTKDNWASIKLVKND